MDSSPMDLDVNPPQYDAELGRLWRSYKDTTNFFLRWLWCQHRIITARQGIENTLTTFRNTAQIRKAAQDVQTWSIAVPSIIITSLEDAIRVRRKVSRIHQKQGDSDQHNNSTHANFFQLLGHILQMLKPLESAKETFTDYATTAEDAKWKNTFSPLRVDDTKESPHNSQPSGSGSGHNATALPTPGIVPASSLPPTSPQQPVTFELEDDDMVQQMALAAHFLIEINKVHKQVKELWEQAARGEAPIALAAWFTSHVAIQIGYGLDIPQYFDTFCALQATPPYEHSTQSSIRTLIRSLDSSQDPDECIKSASRIFMTANVLAEYGWRTRDFEAPEIEGRPSIQKDSPFKHSLGTEEASKMSWWSAARRLQIFGILEAVRTALPASGKDSRPIAYLENRLVDSRGKQVCEAFFDHTRRFFLQTQRPRVPQVPHVTTMDLFLLTEDTVTTPGAHLSRPQCRAAVLRFAMDVQKCVAELRPKNTPFAADVNFPVWADRICRCIQKYSEEQKSDLYYDSPWTMGCHAMELLVQGTCIGFSLCQEYAVLHSILHLYNALRQLNAKGLQIPQNYELEALYRMFALEIFKGEPPRRGFLTSFRYIVYKSHKFPGPPTSEASTLERGLLRGRVRADEPHLLLLEEHLRVHRKGALFLTRVFKNPVARSYVCFNDNCKEHQSKACKYNAAKTRKEHSQSTLSQYTAKVREAAAATFSEDNPESRLNFVKMFQVYSGMLEKFGRSVRGRLNAEYRSKNLWTSHMEYGLELSRFAVEDTLEQIDLNFGPTRKQLVYLRGHPLVKGAVEMFKNMKVGRNPEDAKLKRFLWDLP